jgi:hypothetical protein
MMRAPLTLENEIDNLAYELCDLTPVKIEIGKRTMA